MKKKEIKEKVDVIVEDAKKTLEQDILARQKFISHVENSPISESLKNYKVVAKKHYDDLSDEIVKVKSSISDYGKDSISSIMSKIEDAVEVEGKLVAQLNDVRRDSVSNSDVHPEVNNMPFSLSDVVSNKDRYKKYKMGKSNVYDNTGDEKTYDGSRIGDWTNPRHKEYMKNVVLHEFSEIEKRNIGYEGANEIL